MLVVDILLVRHCLAEPDERSTSQRLGYKVKSPRLEWLRSDQVLPVVLNVRSELPSIQPGYTFAENLR